MKAAVYLQKGKQGTVERGHPWIFPKSILRQNATITGELVEVFSIDNKLLGVGVYNEHSLYRVRMLAYEFEKIDTSSIDKIIIYRLNQALKLRQNIGLPNKSTTAYRLVNSEGDLLSGLTIDVFNDRYVVSSTAFWVEANKENIIKAINEIVKPKNIIWFSQPKPLSQDGWKEEINNETEGKVEVLEAFVKYQVDFSNTQKTGLFIDQRENHQRIAALSYGKKVLDLYSYTGGFALHAALASAHSVTAVDSSAAAIALAKANAALNNISNIDFVEADARDYLSQAKDYDLIILDPPKLVPSQRHLNRAKNYYRFLHQELFKSMKSGTLLMTCNCSSALSSQEFKELVSAQATLQGKVARILGVYGPSSCHPTLAFFPEGSYLTAILLAVM